jgi:hypothetical protein
MLARLVTEDLEQRRVHALSHGGRLFGRWLLHARHCRPGDEAGFRLVVIGRLARGGDDRVLIPIRGGLGLRRFRYPGRHLGLGERLDGAEVALSGPDVRQLFGCRTNIQILQRQTGLFQGERVLIRPRLLQARTETAVGNEAGQCVVGLRASLGGD